MKKLWSQPDAIAFIAEAADVATRAHDDGRTADVARALVTIADVAAAAALEKNSIGFGELISLARPEIVDAIAQPPKRDGIQNAVTRGRTTLGIVDPKAKNDGSDV